MTIRRGEPWGEAVQAPEQLRIVPTDRDGRDWVVHHRERDRDVQPVGLGGGDLARTLGGGQPGRFPGVVTRVPLDVMRIVADGRVTWGVAHVIARRTWWHGPVIMAMNAQFLGSFDIAPRSHPNDGKIDVLEVDATMSARARWQAQRRARTGTHLPHPSLKMSQVGAFVTSFPEPLVIWVDGVRWCTASTLSIDVEPDAFIAYA